MSNRRIVDLILYLQRQDQLFEEGIDSEGNIIGLYAPITEILSDGRKRAGDPYTLYDTGAFYDSFKVKVTQKEIIITSNPMKTDESGKQVNIFEKFNNFKIEGLTDENIDALAKFSKEFFENDFKKRFIRTN